MQTALANHKIPIRPRMPEGPDQKTTALVLYPAGVYQTGEV